MLSRGYLLGLLYALVLLGYPLVGGLVSMLGMGDARWPSIALRVGVGLLALLCLFKSRSSLRAYSPLFLIAFCVFWALYWVRILSDAWWMPVPLPLPATELVVTTLLFSFVPALVGFVGLSTDYSQRAARLVLIVGACALLVLLANSGSFANMALKGEMNRFAVEKLDPISVSLTGAIVMLVAVAQAFSPVNKVTPVGRGLLLLLAGGGLLILLLGNSKGPTIAAAIALLAFALIPLTPRRAVIGGVLALVLVVIAFNMQSTLKMDYGIDVAERFAGADTSESVESRRMMFASAWQVFQSSPVIGGPVMEPITGYYPHNTFLEALMATGFLGGLAYLVCMVIALVACARALHARRGHEWIALVCVAELVTFQFSGSHYASGQHWLLLAGIVFSVNRAEARIAAGVSSRHVGGQFA